MFKIKINDLNRNYLSSKIVEPYEIKFELEPQFCNSLRQTLYHETKFSSLKEAENFAKQLSKFLDDSFFFIDLIYHRINSLGVYNHSQKIEQKSYHDYYVKVQNNRSHIMGLTYPVYAYEPISAIVNYINSLIGIIFFYKDTFRNEANKIYQLLENFKAYFIRNIRSSRELYNNENLQLLW